MPCYEPPISGPDDPRLQPHYNRCAVALCEAKKAFDAELGAPETLKKEWGIMSPNKDNRPNGRNYGYLMYLAHLVFELKTNPDPFLVSWWEDHEEWDRERLAAAKEDEDFYASLAPCKSCGGDKARMSAQISANSQLKECEGMSNPVWVHMMCCSGCGASGGEVVADSAIPLGPRNKAGEQWNKDNQNETN